MTTKKITRTPIDEKEFITAWVRVHKADGGLKDVAEELGCSYAGAKNKAEKLAEQGIKLPELRRGRVAKQVDLAGLKKLLDEQMKKG